MRSVSYLLLALMLLVALVSWFSGDAGYLLLHWRAVTVELTLATLLIAALLLCWLLLQVWRLQCWLQARLSGRRSGENSSKTAGKA